MCFLFFSFKKDLWNTMSKSPPRLCPTLFNVKKSISKYSNYNIIQYINESTTLMSPSRIRPTTNPIHPKKEYITISHNNWMKWSKTYNFSVRTAEEWQPLFVLIFPTLTHERSRGSNLSMVLQFRYESFIQQSIY